MEGAVIKSHFFCVLGPLGHWLSAQISAASNAGTYSVLRELGSQSDLIYDGREEEKRSTHPHLFEPKAREIAIAWSRSLCEIDTTLFDLVDILSP